MSDPEHHAKVEHLHHKAAKHESEIEQLKQGQIVLQNSFHELADKFDAHAVDVTNKFDRVVTLITQRTESKPTNWFALISATVALIALGYTHLAVTQRPIEARLEKAESFIDARRTELKNDYQMFGDVIAEARMVRQHQEKHEERQHEQGLEIARNTARLDMIQTWLEDVDKLGSRKHVLSAPEDSRTPRSQ